ncbi:hypothetical protein GCM10027446_33940 [Angustibacter peucedani]
MNEPQRLRPRDWVRRVVNVLFLATPAGLVLARLGHATLRPGARGTWVATGYAARFPAPRAPAVTIGDVVLLRLDDAALARRPRLLVHEARHTGQWACWLGLLGFPAAYGAASLWSLATVGNPSMNNVFERRAGFVDGGYLHADDPAAGDGPVSPGSRSPARP